MAASRDQTVARRRPVPRLLLAAALGGCALLLSGCIYLRLLQLQRQLKDFDAHFAVHAEAGAGLALEFREPVLREEDLTWFGFVPHTRTALAAQPGADGEGAGRDPRDQADDDAADAAAARLEFRWVKQLPPGTPPEPFVYDLDAAAVVRDGRVATFELPERLFTVLPKALFVDMLRAFGGARVDRRTRSADATIATPTPEVVAPGREAVLGYVGQPWSIETRDGVTVHEYHYAQELPVLVTGPRSDAAGVARTRPARAPEAPPPVIVRLSFDAATGALRAADLRLPRGKFHVALPAVVPPPPAP